MANILLIEDDIKTAGFIKSGLKEECFSVHHAVDGRTGLNLGLKGTFDAAVVDIMLPELDGLGLVEQLRSAGSSMPILFLSGRKTVEDRLSGFKDGGDDYLERAYGVLSVSDNGPGIAKEDREHIFDRFYRGDISRSISGNGLGLALVKAIARKHTGTVVVHSDGKNGSSFVVKLPR